MSKYDMYFNTFFKQYTGDELCDKETYKKYYIKILACGRRVVEGYKKWSYFIPSKGAYINYHLQFLKMIDGNGFNVKQVNPQVYSISKGE